MLNKVGLEMLVAHFGQPLLITNGVSLTNYKSWGAVLPDSRFIKLIFNNTCKQKNEISFYLTNLQ